MRLRNITGSRETIGESPYVVHEPENRKGNWKEVFGNNNPVQKSVWEKESFYMPWQSCIPKSIMWE